MNTQNAIELDVNEQINVFYNFFDSYFLDKILEITRSDKESILIDFSLLSKFNIDLSENLLNNPDETLKTAELALSKFDNTKKILPRFYNLPKSHTVFIRNVRSKHIGKFISAIGVIKQKTGVRPRVIGAKFECPSCGSIISKKQEEQSFTQPTHCSCGRKGRFKLIDKNLIDSQKIVIEESYETLDGGSQPRRVPAILNNDLCSPWSDHRINAGTKVEVTGIVREVPITTRAGGQSTTFEMVIEVNYVAPMEDDFSEITIDENELKEIKKLASDPEVFNLLRESIAPSIYGHELIKDALILQIFGGVRKVRNDGGVTRGDTHILLIGDPGTGKCVSGDTKVILSDGTITTFEKLCEDINFNEDYSHISEGVMSFDLDGVSSIHNATKLWKRKCSEKMFYVKTSSGRELKITENHPLFTTYGGFIYGEEISNLTKGEFIALPRKLNIGGSFQQLSKEFKRSKAGGKLTPFIPDFVDKEIARLFAYIIAESYVAHTNSSGIVSFTNNDLILIDDFRRILEKRFKLPVHNKKLNKYKSSYEIYVSCKEFIYFLEYLGPGIVTSSGNKRVPNCINKSPNYIVREFLKAMFECDGYVDRRRLEVSYTSKSRGLVDDLQILLLRFGIHSSIKKKIKCATNTIKKIKREYFTLSIYGDFARKFSNEIGFISERKNSHLSESRKSNTNIDVIPNVHKILKVLRLKNKLSQFDFPIPRTTYQHYERGDRNPSRKNLIKISDMYMKIDPNNVFAQSLYKLSNSDLLWDKIEEIKEIDSEEYVYDFEVQRTHNFVANGVMIHNSMLVKRISVIAPKSYFVSGKGASGAGLTATVQRDETTGTWVLEAGALVLANKGYLMIDEMDKMNKEDRDAMHSGLEQQEIHVSKANVQATLKCETTVLAAANPKFGRFDPYLTISEQIDMPPSLINRFDLIFPVKDIPDKEKDKKMAEFILRLHQSKGGKITEVPISTELFRKFVAYARQNCIPRLTDEAINKILEEYVEIRNSGGEDNIKSVPISSRQLEGIIRLSEASAKVRLSPTVDIEDAKRAIDLVMHCLMEIAVDQETGKIDIDKISSGISASERNKIMGVKGIIAELEEKIGKVIPIDDIIKEAEKKGISSEKVEEAIEKLKRAGDIFEPRINFISRL